MSTRDDGPTNDEERESALQRLDQEAQLLRTDTSTLSALNKSEVEAQLDAAHRYPRSFTKFVREAQTLGISSQEVAKSCMYTLERKDKHGKKIFIVGPSVRLAEICSSTYTNLHVGSRPVDVGETTVTSQGVCWDVERNVRVITECIRRITTSGGKRYGEDMVVMTQNAASAIARRNAVFQTIPRSLIDEIFRRVREVATGEKKTMEEKRADVVTSFNRLGISIDRVLAKLDRAELGDITIEDIEVLIGYGTRIKEGDDKDELFPRVGGEPQPQPQPAAEGTRTPLRRPTPAAAKKPEDVISTPQGAVAGADPEEVKNFKAAEPTPEEIAAFDAEKTARLERERQDDTAAGIKTPERKRAPWVDKK